ncbi:DUF3037 domain-containing protein [Curtobacterium sp. S6]|uniref:DUF3037 domain-containing protein n=1 Tax=Curtobacterium sp. S6 TaxID=1479623 RepID=UPI0004AA1670|nr:DUF3037 domain-containing protein [Curtobacterium sp. S6]
MLYRTRIVRYVPDTARGEFLNLGVIVMGDDPRDVAIRAVETITEIPNIGGPRSAALEAVSGIVREVESRHESPAELEIDHSSTLRASIDSFARNAYGLIQFSDEGIADGQSAMAVADFLFDHLVSRGTPARREQRLTRLRRRITDTYSTRPTLARSLLSSPRLVAGPRSAPVDLAVLDQNIIEINSAFSFQGEPNRHLLERIDSWAFRMKLLREGNGGVLQHGREPNVPVAPDTPIIAIVDPPQTSAQQELFQEVTAPWSQLEIQTLTSDQIGVHANDLERRLSAA